MLFYLLYFGVARKEFTTEDFDLLLAQARQRNESLEITGKLIHCEGTFIQILEGTEQAVDAVYASISRDERLVAIKLITTGTATHRNYADWSMAFKDISLKEINELEHCTHPNVAEYIESSSAVKLLKLIAKS